MATYLEVVGNNNKIIIDDTTSRLHKTRSYSLATVGALYTLEPFHDYNYDNLIVKIFTYKITLADNETFFSIRAKQPNENVGFAKCVISDKESYLYCYVNAQGKSSFSESNFVIDCYGTSSSGNNQGSGLQIFDETGKNVIFDSNRYYMDVKGFYNFSGSPDLYSESFWPATIDIGKPSYKNSAICINNNRHFLWHEALATALHCVVFGEYIYLKFLFYSNKHTWDYSPESLKYEVWNAGLKYYPNCSSNNSGIILDTTNIS